MNDEFEQFQADLLESTHQMKAGKSVRSHVVKVSAAA
jgi:putative transcriptional regulator